jgi:hypothetical protein
VPGCFVLVRTAAAHSQVITDGRLFAGDTAMVTGSAAGVPAGYERHWRAPLPPGKYQLRLDHHAFHLPASTFIEVTASQLVVEVLASPGVGAVDRFEIVAPTFVADLRNTIALGTTAPSPSAVQWSVANPTVLKLEKAGIFRALAVGLTDVTATYGTKTATTQVFVRSADTPTVIRPPRPGDVVVDPESGARVTKGVLVIGWNPGTSAATQTALLKKHGLSIIGSIDSDAHQVSYDTRLIKLGAIVGAVEAEPGIAFVCPELQLVASGMGPQIPNDIPVPRDWWHLDLTEAYAAFGILKAFPQRTPPPLSFIERGLSVNAAGKFHKDFDGRVDLPSSTFSSGGVQSKAERPSDLRDTAADLHGTGVVGAAAATWNNEAGAGLDPKASIRMHQCPLVITNLVPAIRAASRQPGPRILTLTAIIDTSTFTRAANNLVYPQLINFLIVSGGLVVIAAGNQGTDIKDVGVASVKEGTPFDTSIIVVGATERLTDQAYLEERRLVDAETKNESNFDTPGFSHIDLAAPGEVMSSGVTNGLEDSGRRIGTSFAAPLVSGAAAMLWSLLPSLKGPEVKQILVETSDPIAPFKGTPARPMPPLWTEEDRQIGKGRLNVWQALLKTLNLREGAASTVRHVGIRARVPEAFVRFYLTYDKKQVEIGVVTTATQLWGGHTDAAITIANSTTTENPTGAFPTAITAHRRNADQTYPVKPTWRLPLKLDAAVVDKLSPRYVVTCRAFMKGGVALMEITPKAATPNRAAFDLSNTGSRPVDLDLLDPIGRRPHDKSLRRWMALAAGDSYAVTLNVLPGSAPVSVRLLDANLHPLTGLPVDDSGRPYITIPFGTPPVRLHVEGTFQTTDYAEAQVEVVVESLNNAVVQASRTVTLRSKDQPEIRLVCAPGWIFSDTRDYWIRDVQSCTIQPTSWQCRYFIEPEVSAHQGPTLPPGGGAITTRIRVELESPASEVPPASAVCTLRDDKKSFRLTGTLELPVVEVKCAEPLAAFLKPEGQALKATFEVTLRNLSKYGVYVKGYESRDALLPAHAPPGADLRLAFVPQGSTAPAAPEFGLGGPGGEAKGTITIYYARSVLSLPAGTVGARRVRLRLFDPRRLPLGTGAQYLSVELTLKAVLQLPPA